MRARRFGVTLALSAAAAAMAMGVAACGGDDNKTSSGGDTAGGGNGSDFTIGLVSDVGKFNDRSFNQAALEGLERAQKELDVKGSPIESAAAGDYIPNLTTLARKKTSLSIGVGFLMADGIDTVATKFPKQNFAIVDFSQQALKHKPKNVRGLTFATNENSYLVGYMAAKMAEQKNKDAPVISAVGGMKIPTVEIFIAGYKAGALAANPKTKVLIGYSQEFVAQDKCKELALNQIQQGSQVVFQVAGGCGLGALSAAKEKGVWGVGVDRDQSDLGDHILTSAVKRVDTAVYDSAKDVVDGTFTGGDKLYDLKSDGVALGKVSPKVPKELVDEVNGLKQKIIDGEIKDIPTTVS